MTARPTDPSLHGRNAAARALILVLLLAPGRFFHAAEPLGEPAPDKPVHRFLHVEISPDGGFVASVEGDSPIGGYYPSASRSRHQACSRWQRRQGRAALWTCA